MINSIENGELGSSVRAKLNQTIDSVNDFDLANGAITATVETFAELRSLSTNGTIPFAIVSGTLNEETITWVYKLTSCQTTCTDNNLTVIVPTGGDGSAAWIYQRDLKGDEGEKGDKGETGPTGATGSRGPRGYIGSTGEKGDPGNYTGVAVTAIVATTLDLPGTGSAGEIYGVGSGNDISLYGWNGTEWFEIGPIYQPDPEVHHTIYVAPHGNDANDGRTLRQAVRTLERAVELSTELSLLHEDVYPTLVNVYPGEYETQGHLDWPDKCSVVSVGGARKTNVVPAPGYEVRNVFRLGEGGYVEGFSFEGWQLDTLGKEYNELEENLYGEGNFRGDAEGNPSEGFAISFRPGAIIRRVPYVHNIVAHRGQPSTLITAPLDRATGNAAVGNGMGVVLADRSVISEYSTFPNIMTWGATPSVPNGIGYYAKNNALVNPVNAISLWCHKAFMCTNGGQMILSGCSSQFGDYSLWSEGSAFSVTPEKYDSDTYTALRLGADVNDTVTAIIDNNQAILDAMWAAIVNDWNGGLTPEREAYTMADAGNFLLSLRYSLSSASDRTIRDFTLGLFDYNGDPVFDVAILPLFVESFEVMRDTINGLSISADCQSFVTGLTQIVIDTITNPVKRRERSLVTAINHQWTLPMAGVTRTAVPQRFGGGGKATRIPRSIVQKDGGRVRYSGQDDEGNAVFVGGLQIDSQSGELRGPPFDLAVKRTATRTTIARSF